MTGNTFVQLGATRDGLDPYLTAARARGLRACLVDTPDYLAYRAGVPGRRAFDVEVGVETPADPNTVAGALARAGVRPRVVLAGFDRYAAAAFALADPRGERPAPPFDKAAQRHALARAFPDQPQPAFTSLPDTRGLVREFDRFPGEVVVKAVDAAGGLGVYRVATRAEAAAAAARLERLRNYDGAAFAGVLLEELTPGEEFSIQGMARDGEPDLLSVCEKVIESEPDPDAPYLFGFRERAHLARPGGDAPPEFAALAARCLTAFGYRDGPFQIDLIRGADGRAYFLEMGYRLSGVGLVRTLQDLTGRDWGDLALGWALGRERPPAAPPRFACVGQALLRGPADRLRAMAVGHPRLAVAVEEFAPPAPGRAAPAAEALRHAGFVGRVRVCGPAAEVRKAIDFVLGRGGEYACAG